MDRIGSLPKEVRLHILSFLTTKEAASTSALSKNWRMLWTLVPNIDIDDTEFLNPEEGKRERVDIIQSFTDFVDRVLDLHGDSPITKFSLKCKDGNDPDRMNLWICNVLQRGVTKLDLVLDFLIRGNDFIPIYKYHLPKEMFVSSKLVELKIRSELAVHWWRGGREAYLPMLKSLNILAAEVYLYSKLEVFLSAFPVLEELYLSDIVHMVSDATASSASLRKLTISTIAFQIYRNPKSVSFDTPNLVYLDYCDFVAADYPKVNLPNLVEALLYFRVHERQINLIREPHYEDEAFLRLRNVWKLINGMRNVQRLSFSADTLEVLSLCCESMPVFNNLKFLRIASDEYRGWQAMPVLLRKCPHLETLVFEGVLHYVTDKCGDACDCISRKNKGRSLSTCPVKKLQIKGFQKTVREKEMIKHFLKSFPCLDKNGIEVYP